MCGFWGKKKEKAKMQETGLPSFQNPVLHVQLLTCPMGPFSKLEVLWSIYILLVASQAYLLKPFRSLDPFLKN